MGKLSLTDFDERYGRSTERRQELMEELMDWVAVARTAAGLQRIWVFGSFITAKPGPNDMGIISIVRRGYRIEDVPSEFQRYFDPEFCRNVLDLDLSIFVEGDTDIYVPALIALLGTDGHGRVIAIEVEP